MSFTQEIKRMSEKIRNKIRNSTVCLPLVSSLQTRTNWREANKLSYVLNHTRSGWNLFTRLGSLSSTAGAGAVTSSCGAPDRVVVASTTSQERTRPWPGTAVGEIHNSALCLLHNQKIPLVMCTNTGPFRQNIEKSRRFPQNFLRLYMKKSQEQLPAAIPKPVITRASGSLLSCRNP